MGVLGWVFGFSCLGIIFAGTYVVAHNALVDQEPYVEKVGVPVPQGDFEDVHVTMTNSLENRFRWVCDMHLTAGPAPDTAECQYTDEDGLPGPP